MMNMKNRSLPILTAAIVGVGCTDAPTAEGGVDLVVVEAYLFAGEPVADVRLTESVPLGIDPVEAPSINDAQVVLIKNGVSYALQPTGEGGYYEYSSADLAIETGDLFRLEVSYFGKVAVGETVVPEPPVNVAIDGDTLFAPIFGRGGPGQGGFNLQNAQLAATWENPDERLHFVVLESLDEDTESILPDQLLERIGRFRFISEPTVDDFYIIRLLALRDLGRHEARIHRVNQEYADLYENRTQDSRDLNEPPSNITDGLGVFSAFASQSAFFEVARQPNESTN